MSADDELSAQLRIEASVRQKVLEIAELPLSELVDGLKSLVPNDLLASSPTMLDFFIKTKRLVIKPGVLFLLYNMAFTRQKIILPLACL